MLYPRFNQYRSVQFCQAQHSTKRLLQFSQNSQLKALHLSLACVNRPSRSALILLTLLFYHNPAQRTSVLFMISHTLRSAASSCSFSLLPVADDDGLFRTGKRECPGREVHLRGLIDDLARRMASVVVAFFAITSLLIMFLHLLQSVD